MKIENAIKKFASNFDYGFILSVLIAIIAIFCFLTRMDGRSNLWFMFLGFVIVFDVILKVTNQMALIRLSKRILRERKSLQGKILEKEEKIKQLKETVNNQGETIVKNKNKYIIEKISLYNDKEKLRKQCQEQEKYIERIGMLLTNTTDAYYKLEKIVTIENNDNK